MSNRVIAKQVFSDALTGRSYRPGDVVEGWAAERAAHFAARGVVRVEGPGPEEVPATGPSEAPTVVPEEAPATGPNETPTMRRPKTRK